ncbi:MAG TPA: metalloregulator ArsR/SmtB family transcription factor [Nocardioides sp.]|jgi:ArsR family transcriptional regulator
MPVPLYQVKAEFFRTLGHPARIRTLELLAVRDMPVHELLASISIEASNLSQQLSVLRRAGLVIQRREGSEVIYSLAIPEVRDLLLAARVILTSMRGGQAEFVDELSRLPTGGGRA